MQLDPTAIEAGAQLVALGTIGSTNKEARQRARLGEKGPLWITAAAQTEGRGRMDRTWVSPQGNLYASLLLTEPSPFERAPELAFVTALAVRDAVLDEARVLAPRLSFKWPNDLLLAGEKCAGILIEGETGPDHSVCVIIGIGVNCVSHPPTASDRPATDLGATDLGAHGAAVTAPQLFRRLSVSMIERIRQWDSGRGFAAIRTDWLAAAYGIGEDLAVRNGGREKRGRFGGLDQYGRLLLQLPGGLTENISAGDVFPLGGGSDPQLSSRQG